MGGCGSGRHRGVRKRRVESCLALDVNELRRKGVLTPGAFGTLSWECGGDARASVVFRVGECALTLCYHDQRAAEPRDVEQRVALSSVPGRFGGARDYFLCPGAECGRRVSILYFRRGVFRCRHCHGLAYESQREDARLRARRRADKLRAQLGWPQRGHLRRRSRSSQRGCGLEPLSACAAVPLRPSRLPPRLRWRIGLASSAG